MEVEFGDTLRTVADQLEQDGIIDSAWSFRLYAKVFQPSATIDAGQHPLVVGDRYLDLLTTLDSSPDVSLTVTFPEGFTVEQMGARLEKELGITPEAWAAASAGREGYLFPDTYRFSDRATAENIVTKMSATFDNRVAAIGAPTGRAANYTPAELITLASIIEREVRDKEAMRQVADIFLKRLDLGMALQSDATINYILDTGLSGVTLEHTKLDNPYNTYQYPGLPPGPISNPGMNALDAAFHPAANEYYYFLTDEAGRIYYGQTHTDHLNNRRAAGL